MNLTDLFDDRIVRYGGPDHEDLGSQESTEEMPLEGKPDSGDVQTRNGKVCRRALSSDG
jgi:hypothetical protein